MPTRAAQATVSPERPEVDLFAPVRESLHAVDACIRHELRHDSRLVGDLATHLLGGGKRLRPALVLLAGGVVGADPERLLPVAAACEIIHMATLVHDDLIDASDRRRGVPTVHAKWGVPSSVLIGDHLFAKGFSILAEFGDPAVVRLMSGVVSRTCTGEIEEIASQWDIDATVAQYFARVHAKTGFFIAECCRMGAVVGGAAPQMQEALATYGREVGDCFQVVDDLLDLTASPAVLGKPTGSDLRAGVFTLAVLHTLHGPYGEDLRQRLSERPLRDGDVAEIAALLRRSGALAEVAAVALAMAGRAQAALAPLPESPHRLALAALAQELTHRVS